MLQVREHPRVLWFLVTVSAVFWFFMMVSSRVLSPRVLWPAFKSLGWATTAAVVASFFLNRYLWSRFPFRNILRIPVLSGRWEGWSYRAFENGESVWRPSAHEISQRALDITAVAWGPSNRSQSICASIVGDSHGGSFELVWSYTTTTVSPSPDNQAGDSHYGTHFHLYSERDGHKYLEGFYVTNRIRQDKTVGSGGYHVLVYVSKDLKNGLAYDEKTWPPKPDFHPFAKVSSENASNSGVASNSSQTA